MDGYHADNNEYLITKKEKLAKQTAKGRIQVEKNVRKVMKKSLIHSSNILFGENSFLNKFFNSLYILIGLDT